MDRPNDTPLLSAKVIADRLRLDAPPDTLMFDSVTALDCMAVVRYAPALCRAVVMLEARPQVIVEPLELDDSDEPVAKLICPVEPLIEFTT